MKQYLFIFLCISALLTASADIAGAGVSRDTSGFVHLLWRFRSGECHIRYTEDGQVAYKYNVVTSCDAGEFSIGGLERGKQYRFQVSPDGIRWTKAVTSIAKSPLTMLNEQSNRSGSIQLVWKMRGGTCSFRYTEDTEKNYKYFTETQCNDGKLVINHLVSEKKYRFQLSQNNRDWSKSAVSLAR